MNGEALICDSDICNLNDDSHELVKNGTTHCEHKYQLYESAIAFDLPFDVYEYEQPHNLEIYFDDDGDIVAERRYQHHIIKIEHCAQTTVSHVGLQVWPAALLLSDYLIHIRKGLNGKCILELGAGLGICSMISSFFAKQVFCTDIGEKILSLCERNVTKFIEDFKSNFSVGIVKVKQLNWLQGGNFLNSEESKFGWSETEKESMKDISMFIASDVIYDDDLTQAFIGILIALMEKSNYSCLLLSLERRLNFAVDVLDVTSPHYDFFMREINSLTSKRSERWNIRNIPIDFPQYFHYKRSKYLELWMLEFKKS